ncbi:MAG: Nif3-like dinuclear metal center hexameric protein [Prevotella sp.]|nr:Nif3-like dinuclear metal center hexameric protein [Prevotella sp.]
MKIKEVLSALERFAPLPLQESWDNAGLQVGLTETEVSGALLCLDVNEQIVDEAMRKGCNLIVSHHPLLFRGLKQVSGSNYVQRTVMKAIKNDVCVVSMHTNMDNAWGGVNFKIAEKMGAKPIAHKASTTAPEGDTNVCRQGNEAPSGDERGAVKIPMVLAELPQPMAARDFVQMVKERFGVACAQCNELLQRPVRKVAICGGAGDFMLPDALAAGADAFVTGEMHYHVFFDYEQKLQICVIGHYQSEQFTSEVFRDIIHRECPEVRTEIAETNTNPIKYL